MGIVKGRPQEKFRVEGMLSLAICCQEGRGVESRELFLTPVLRLQIQKIIKEPVPDSGLLSLFQGQNPLFC